ncbi:hypothetical protein CRUP_033075 [Coryphaenoides rupestris]|nr:hypothetical protein CRUP_033075 [Coryphaenoides rupestris]
MKKKKKKNEPVYGGRDRHRVETVGEIETNKAAAADLISAFLTALRWSDHNSIHETPHDPTTNPDPEPGLSVRIGDVGREDFSDISNISIQCLSHAGEAGSHYGEQLLSDQLLDFPLPKAPGEGKRGDGDKITDCDDPEDDATTKNLYEGLLLDKVSGEEVLLANAGQDWGYFESFISESKMELLELCSKNELSVNLFSEEDVDNLFDDEDDDSTLSSDVCSLKIRYESFQDNMREKTNVLQEETQFNFFPSSPMCTPKVNYLLDFNSTEESGEYSDDSSCTGSSSDTLLEGKIKKGHSRRFLSPSNPLNYGLRSKRKVRYSDDYLYDVDSIESEKNTEKKEKAPSESELQQSPQNCPNFPQMWHPQLCPSHSQSFGPETPETPILPNNFPAALPLNDSLPVSNYNQLSSEADRLLYEKSYLAEAGLQPGADVQVCQSAALEGQVQYQRGSLCTDNGRLISYDSVGSLSASSSNYSSLSLKSCEREGEEEGRDNFLAHCSPKVVIQQSVDALTPLRESSDLLDISNFTPDKFRHSSLSELSPPETPNLSPQVVWREIKMAGKAGDYQEGNDSTLDNNREVKWNCDVIQQQEHSGSYTAEDAQFTLQHFNSEGGLGLDKKVLKMDVLLLLYVIHCLAYFERENDKS